VPRIDEQKTGFNRGSEKGKTKVQNTEEKHTKINQIKNEVNPNSPPSLS
jgi:hypothetical protein